MTLSVPALVSIHSSCSRGLARGRHGCTCTGFTGRWGSSITVTSFFLLQNVFSPKITQLRVAWLPLYLLWPEDTVWIYIYIYTHRVCIYATFLKKRWHWCLFYLLRCHCFVMVRIHPKLYYVTLLHSGICICFPFPMALGCLTGRGAICPFQGCWGKRSHKPAHCQWISMTVKLGESPADGSLQKLSVKQCIQKNI